jgi:7,8-dihydroneopterin 2',3'-cyclic phosphate phosphodiesterase
VEGLIRLAERIKDESLRKKVVDYIRDPTPTHKDFKKYPKEEWEKVKTYFSIGGVPAERDVLNHTIAVTEMCAHLGETIEKNYGTKVNMDALVAGALIHDAMKLIEWKMGKMGPEHTGVMLDHTFLGVAELYARGFPEDVIHIVAAHFGENGPTPPRTMEAYIVHSVDSLLSTIEYNINAGKAKSQLPMLYLDQETLDKLKQDKGE